MSKIALMVLAPLALALAPHGPALAQAADVTGKWVGEVKIPNGPTLPFVGHFKQDNGTVSGKLDGIGGPDVTITNGKISNDVLTFNSVRPINGMPVAFAYTGHVAGDGMDLEIVQTDGKAAPLKSRLTRTPE